ncbi:MAG TPA: zinc-dependent metalloprotease [Candidatus Kapabacteria bacterium]|nr:zinc-dependent metalloprotease [Candidatus Kapabacteria bacterium]
MKQLYVASILAIIFLSARSTLAQCNIPCCDEEFPYVFCTPNGQTEACSKDPNHDPTFPNPPNFPAKATYLPSSVCVYEASGNVTWLPTTQPPTPPTDPGGPGAAHDQWVKDIAAWNSGQNIPNEPTNTCGPDPCGTEPQCAADDPCGTEPTKYESDGVTITQAWQNWDDCETGADGTTTHADWVQCLSDHTIWVNCEAGSGSDGPAHDTWVKCNSDFALADAQWHSDNAAFTAAQTGYTQVWDQTQAQSDANAALQNWLALCGLSGSTHSDCCLQVMEILDPNNFTNLHANPQTTLAATVGGAGGLQAGFPGCNETSCPDRWIEVNNCPQFLYQSSNPNATGDPGYTFHSVPKLTFFTGTTPPSGTANGYGACSFYQLMEHEIGHYLGMHHPEELGCNNNANRGCPQVMSQSQNIPNGIPKNLTSDDQCQFKKLYCDPCSSKVLGDDRQSVQPQIYPNPSTGVTNLQYEVNDFTFVKISLCDILGKEIIVVFSGLQSEGYYQLSLPTQYLPSGNYICRILTEKNQYNLKFTLTK